MIGARRTHAARLLAPLLAIATLAACGGNAASAPPASGQPSGPGASSVQAWPVTTEGPVSNPGPAFAFGSNAVATTTLAGSPGAKFINPGAVIEADGVLHMFPNVFDSWPGLVTVSYLASADGGVTWALETGAPVLSSEDTPLADPGIDVSTGYIAEDGTWVLIFETVSAVNPWVLGQATAPGPRGPWTFEEAPILTPGPEGSWDDGGLQWPSVVRIGDQLAIFYTALDQVRGRTGAIGMAVLEGATWTKRELPVLVASEDWELGSVDRPRVVATATGLVMVYAGLDLTSRGLATSEDGVTWEKVPGPAISAAQFPITGGAWDAALIHREAQLVYFLEIGQGSTSTSIHRGVLAWQ